MNETIRVIINIQEVRIQTPDEGAREKMKPMTEGAYRGQFEEAHQMGEV